MEEVQYILDSDLAPYVNCIMTGEHLDDHSQTRIPLYADGYPGIMFQKSINGFYHVSKLADGASKKKALSEFFLYGQTLRPIALEARGPYSYVVIQLYPFASKYLLNVDPRTLNDDCYDLLQIEYARMYKNRLLKSTHLDERIEIISEFMRRLISTYKASQNDQIEKAISIIIQKKGQVKIKDLLENIHLTERTLERNFMSYVGITPKQFAKIIQFQKSIDTLTKSTFESLLNIGLDSGFSDQSHFIREFKKYTGQTPSFYLRQLTT